MTLHRKSHARIPSRLTVLAVFAIALVAPAQDATSGHYLITNDNKNPNTATVFILGGTQADPLLTDPVAVGTGGVGTGSPNDAAKTVITVNVGTTACAFVSNTGSGTVTGIRLPYTFAGDFAGSSTDKGLGGLVSNGKTLYAAFDGSLTIATFKMNAGCTLTFLGDVSATGNGTDSVNGMALNGNILVVAYGDGMIESFNTSGTLPVSNGDTQFSSGHSNGQNPSDVDITADGSYAIFGDFNGAIEVSSLSAGFLAPTIVFNVGVPNASNIRLDPSENLLYISGIADLSSAAKFNKSTGVVTEGCSSPQNGFVRDWGIAEALPTGTGAVLYATVVANFSGVSQIRMFPITIANKTCTLGEPVSPVSDPNGNSVLSIAVYPPRSF